MSFEIEPAPIDPGRRTVHRVATGTAAIVVVIAIAIVKPWDLVRAGPDGHPVTAAVAPSSPTPSPTTTATPPASPSSPSRTPVPTMLTSVLTTHVDWGAVVLLGQSTLGRGSTFVERWTKASPAVSGLSSATLDSSGGSIAGIGFTTPLDRMPLESMIWQIQPDGEIDAIENRPVSGGAGTAFVFLRQTDAASGIAWWAPGRYRIEVVTTEGIRRIAIDVVAQQPGTGYPRSP